MVTVLVPGALRTESGGESRLEVASDGTPRAVLDEVSRRWPRLGRRIRDERGDLRRYVNVYVDGEDCRMLDVQETPVAPGAEVQVLPSVAGGSAPAEAAVAAFDGDRVLAENFAPWVQELGLS